jgi:plasmid stabilization system protein ParE
LEEVSLLVYLTNDAREQAREASDWWSAASSNLFMEELDRALELISDNPNIGEAYNHPKLSGIRRRLLQKTSYYLYYRKDPKRNALQVLCLWSTRRGSPPPIK